MFRIIFSSFINDFVVYELSKKNVLAGQTWFLPDVGEVFVTGVSNDSVQFITEKSNDLFLVVPKKDFLIHCFKKKKQENSNDKTNVINMSDLIK